MMATFKYTKSSKSVKAGMYLVPANFVVSIRPNYNILKLSYLI